MYYLTKFCRICIQTGVKLLDIDTIDFDSVKLSEKLEICMKMVVSRESLSTEICIQCIKKLRISYDFQNMCKQSTKILQGYLNELISSSNKVVSNNFINSELRVTLTPISCKNVLHHKRKRITKEQRCSLLKKLLLSTKDEIDKEKDKFQEKSPVSEEIYRGGLRNIINFTKNYDFGYDYDNNHNYNNETSPLGKLAAFSDNFFTNSFTDFRDTILYIIENKDNLFESDDDDEMFNKQVTEEDEKNYNNNKIEIKKEINFEEVIVEPDIKIKYEVEYEDCENDDYPSPYNYLETSYECKKESEDDDKNDIIIPSSNHIYQQNKIFNTNSSMDMLDKLVGKFAQRKTFSQHSVRCRTRGNPYINPQLKQQFQMRSFRCDKCNRYFKSPGYLKAHTSKVHP